MGGVEVVAVSEPNFDLSRALDSWRTRYPNREERIAALQTELTILRERQGKYPKYADGRPMLYPQTIANVQRMLTALTGGRDWR